MMTEVIRTDRGPEIKTTMRVDSAGHIHFGKESVWQKLMKKIITA